MPVTVAAQHQARLVDLIIETTKNGVVGAKKEDTDADETGVV